MWKDRLRKGSFKGIPFYIEDHEAEVGRRVVVNEYPYRDEPYSEDMGRAARRYSITVYMIGDDYMTDRDRMLDAIESGGAGVLIHPYLGTKDVICESGRLRETKGEGRFATFSLSFVEAGRQLFPNSLPIPKDLVGLRADELIAAARASFINGMTVSGVSQWVRDSYAGSISDVADIFDVIRTNGGINKQTTTGLINLAAEWVADVADLKIPSIGLIRDLAGAADRIIDSIAGIFNLSPNADVAAKNLQRFSNFTNPRNGAPTAAAKIADQNAAVSENFVRTVAVATETKAAVARNYPSYDDALSARTNILGRLDTLAGQTIDDNIYNSFRALRAEVSSAIPNEDSALPRIGNVSLKQSAPSLVLAYDLYEGVEREQEIIDRNKIRHPGFLPGGQPLSVLRDVEDTA